MSNLSVGRVSSPKTSQVYEVPLPAVLPPSDEASTPAETKSAGGGGAVDKNTPAAGGANSAEGTVDTVETSKPANKVFSVEAYMEAQAKVGRLENKLNEVDHARLEHKNRAVASGAKVAVSSAVVLVGLAASILPTGVGQLVAVLVGAYGIYQAAVGVVSGVRWAWDVRAMKRVKVELEVAKEQFREQELLRLKEFDARNAKAEPPVTAPSDATGPLSFARALDPVSVGVRSAADTGFVLRPKNH